MKNQRGIMKVVLVPVWASMLLFISACGGGSGGGSGEPTIAAPPAPLPAPPPPLDGPASTLASDSIADVYVEGLAHPSEYSEDAFGRDVHRVGLKIVFLDTATVGDVNDVLIRQSAEIVASLAGFPALVVRIPDPGTLSNLDVVIAEIEAEPSVHSVIRSVRRLPRALPENYTKSIFDQSFPPIATEWDHIDHHLAIRAAAAWGLQSMSQLRPTVILPDHFGGGAVDTGVFNIAGIPGQTDLGFRNAIPPRTEDSHGYAMLSLIASEHSPAGEVGLQDFTTGLVPGGIRLGVVDTVLAYTDVAVPTDLMKLIGNAIATTTATIVVNYSLGPHCTGFAATDPCIPREELQNEVINFIREIRHIGAEQRVLFVAAAGNVPIGGSPATEPTDARSSSHINASALMDNWTDIVTGETYPSLKNVLVVENAVQDVQSMPFLPGCITESSFVGGHIAGIGIDVHVMKDGKNAAGKYTDGGTSSATAQVSGVAAYLASLNPGWSPQDIIRILTKTAGPLSGEASDCTPLTSSAQVVDAYAAALTVDPPGILDPQLTQGRIKLLDITNAALEDGAPDNVFNIYDLQKWVTVLTNDALLYKDRYYSQYDLNGDGEAGPDGGPNRFDLDVSMDPTNDFSVPFSAVQFDFLGSPVTYFENSVTDAEIVCYYANSPLYELVDFGQFTADSRDEELEKLRSQCDPCAKADASSLRAAAARATQTNSGTDSCEGVVVNVSPSSTTLAPGSSMPFSATVTGATDTSVTWTATGGAIDPTGSFTAGNVEGVFSVTATSVEDPSVSTTAAVTIEAVELPDLTGAYSGTALEFYADGELHEEYSVIFDVVQTGSSISIEDRNKTDYMFEGTISGNSISAQAINCDRDGVPCELSAVVELVETPQGQAQFLRIVGTFQDQARNSIRGYYYWEFSVDNFSD